jgi:hypothetical protein
MWWMLCGLWYRVRYCVTALGDLPRTVVGLSVPSRITLVVAVFLVAMTALGLGLQLWGVFERQDSFHWNEIYLLAVLLLLVVTPVVVHTAATLWMQEESSPHEDIEKAWKQIVAELSSKRIDVAGTPLFLVVGTTDPGEGQRLLSQAHFDFSVNAFPGTESVVHAWGDKDAVFLCVDDSACRSSDAARRGTGRSPAEFDPNLTAYDSPYVVAPAVGRAAVGADLDSTAYIDAGPRVAREPAPRSRQEREDLGDRLRYLCELVRRQCQGNPAFGGVLALVPRCVVAGTHTVAWDYGKELGADLVVMIETLGLRVPVTILVTGMEEERGFPELVRRWPADRRGLRIGQGFHPGATPKKDELTTIARRACGLVEGHAMESALRTEGSVEEPDNAELISLVCRSRGVLTSGLGVVLCTAFDVCDEAGGPVPFLTGCYLCADGKADSKKVEANEGTTAFVRAIFYKLWEAHEIVEWTPEAIDADERDERLARRLWLATALCVAIVLGVVAWFARRGG